MLILISMLGLSGIALLALSLACLAYDLKPLTRLLDHLEKLWTAIIKKIRRNHP